MRWSVRLVCVAVICMMASCGGSPEDYAVVMDGGAEAQASPSQRTPSGGVSSTYGGAIPFAVSEPICETADCEQPDYRHEDDVDPLDGPGIIGSSPPLSDGDHVEMIDHPGSYEYHRIDVKIDWDRGQDADRNNL